MKKIIHYTPRILVTLLTIFFGLFILEGFTNGFNRADFWVDLIVTLFMASMTYIAWKHSKIGGFIFVILGIFFIFFFHGSLLIGLTIGGITAMSGVLFLIDDYER
jgi:hypothetical protein